jgi:hypothetical protein
MRRHVLIVVMAVCAAGFAQYDELWVSEEVGQPQSIHVLGVQNTDADPELELIYVGEEPFRDGLVYIWALDLVTGEVEPVTDEFYFIHTDAGKEPRLVDVEGDDRYEILFLGQIDPGEYASWFLYGFAAGSGSREGQYTRLRGPRLNQNVPNPLKTETRIDYVLPKPAKVGVSIYDASGRLVKQLGGATEAAGKHSVVWNRDDAAGRPVPQGSYFYVLEADGKKTSRKALVAE